MLNTYQERCRTSYGTVVLVYRIAGNWLLRTPETLLDLTLSSYPAKSLEGLTMMRQSSSVLFD